MRVSRRLLLFMDKLRGVVSSLDTLVALSTIRQQPWLGGSGRYDTVPICVNHACSCLVHLATNVALANCTEYSSVRSSDLLLALTPCVCLQDSLPVVLHRFSNGVEVVKCVVEFCNVSNYPLHSIYS